MKQIICIIVMLMTAGAWAEESEHPVFATPPTVDRLDNGLTIVTVPWNTPGIVAYYTLVTVGARDEVEPGRSGFAHLFEHMMFRGTETRPGEQYERALEAFGSDTNAYTTNDYTVYTITAPSSALPSLVEIEADRFQRLSYDEEGFRTETGAVLGEYNTGASDPGSAIYERIRELAFREHTYGHTTLGYLADVCAMPEMMEYSHQFFERYYTPDNTTLIVVGDVDRAGLLPLVEAHYGPWLGQRYQNQVPTEPEPTEGARSHIAWSGTTAPRVLIGYRAPAFDGDATDGEGRRAALSETAALEVVRALAFDESSPLYQRLVVDEERLTRLSSWSNSFTIDPGLFTVSATLRPGESFDAQTGFEPVLESIQAELARIATGDVSAERVAAVQSHIRYALLARLETPGRVAGTLAQFIAVGDDVSAMAEYLAALATLTPEDVAAAAATYLVSERRFTVTTASAGEGEVADERPTCLDLRAERNEGEQR